MTSPGSFLRLLPYKTRRIPRRILSWFRGILKDPPKPILWSNGVPEGLNQDRLNSICLNRFGHPISRSQYYHLSGWKEAGAYRIRVLLSNGREQSLVYKNALYNYRQIPALSGFPAIPGPPEFEVYKNGPEVLHHLLPEIYDIEEVVPGRNYRYIFENLGLNYQFPPTPEHKLKIVEKLPQIHESLSYLEERVDRSKILVYNHEFSTALQEYARESLERYERKNSNDELVRLLDQWDQITAIHSRKDIYEIQSPVFIHGDLNFSNVFLNKRDTSEIRLVDWEWAGMGLPHADLAALLKGTPAEVEEIAIRLYADRNPSLSLTQHKKVYYWCQLERSMNDAAFLAAQILDSDHKAKINLPRSVESSVRRIFVMFNRLTILQWE